MVAVCTDTIRCVTATADGYLPAALDKLHDAVSALVDERKAMIGGSVRIAPSLYAELVAEIPSSPGASGVHALRRPGSTTPVWLDGMELLGEIDTAIKAWTHSGSGSTPARLRALASYAPANFL